MVLWIEPWLNAILASIFGLLVGSFLNVVIYRLPKILERQWATEAAEYSAELGSTPPSATEKPEVFNLLVPRSRCQNCGHQVRAHENIPILSYLFLQRRSVPATRWSSWSPPLCSFSASSAGALRRPVLRGAVFLPYWSRWQ